MKTRKEAIMILGDQYSGRGKSGGKGARGRANKCSPDKVVRRSALKEG